MVSMKRTLLAILAHPDDESYGPGGTLAKYAAEGAEVHVAIATDGAAGTPAEGYEQLQAELAAHRQEELVQATRILGVHLHSLGYRDSGMRGDVANDHPLAFVNSDDQEAVGRVVRLIREIKPQVVMTHDETGGYFHPDHIRCWQVTTKAFESAGTPHTYPELNLPPYQPDRLYYTAFPNRWVKVVIRLMRLRGQDPTRMGRNRDIDFTKLGLPANKIHAHIDIRRYWEVKQQASAAHGSQGGGTGMNRLMPVFLQKQLFGTESFQRAYPPAPDGFREKELFAPS